MSITLTQAIEALLKGVTIEWPKFQDHKPGAIALEQASQRRLLKYLLSLHAGKLAAPDETVFRGLIAAWTRTDDPASAVAASTATATVGSWRLAKLEASGFGGLTIFGGPVFELPIEEENWCLEGQNGSGKTSVTNAIVWAMTGRRVSEQHGLIEDSGERAPVYNDDGRLIGDWPPVVSYPEKAAELSKTAEAWVRLTFKNSAGETATAFRKITSPRQATPVKEAVVDPRLTIAPQLIETGLLMPARVPRAGFGNRSQPLYEAVKLLTGLDQLADIAEAARLLTHHGQPFLKFAKQQGSEFQAEKFHSSLAKADAKAGVLDIDLSKCRVLSAKETPASLGTLSQAAAARAGEHLATLKSVIASGLDTADANVRVRIRTAVADARAILNQGVKGITEFEAWTALKQAKDDPAFSNALKTAADAHAALETAIIWHARQLSDQKLRLKALAAQYFIAPHGHDEPGLCPLCEAQLSSASQKALQNELAELKAHADAAERKLGDVCAEIKHRLAAVLTPDLRKHHDALLRMVPKDAYGAAALARFAGEEPFKSTLTGIAEACRKTVERQVSTLPEFGFVEFVSPATDTPESAADAARAIHCLERLAALVTWWSENGGAYREAWAALVQAKDEKGAFRTHTVAAQVASLEQAIEKAEPLDDIAALLIEAGKAAGAWQKIQEQQEIRENIATALAPLKDLRLLVDAETARAIARLSGRIKTVLDQLHLRERFQYEGTALQKKAVAVEGSFDAGMRIDAAMVANASWLRAILWAFILALREETLEALGVNPFPLVVMDDPQTTFDPRNKRKWAEVLAKAANMPAFGKDGMQLILTTHEQQFFKFLVDEQKLSGQQGLIAPVNKVARVATVANGNTLGRQYAAAVAANDDTLAHKFISDVRIYCEDLLKCMMRAEGPHIAGMNLDSLKKELKRLWDTSVAPFNRSAFQELSDMLMGGGGGPMKLINDSHHQFDGTIGVAQAHDVNAFWTSKLQKHLHKAFQVFNQFEAFSGDPRAFSWQDTTAEFPDGHSAAVKAVPLKNTGIAAAAKTGGRAGDGVLTIEEWKSATPVTLHNHDVYQLAAGTLDPVAGIGDFLIVSNYAPVTRHSLAVAAFGDRLLARRYNEADTHPDMVILTGQTLEPHELPGPLLAPREKLVHRKIVGTLFAAHSAPAPAKTVNREFAAVPDFALVQALLKDARLFEVQGRSAEPVALEGQFLITRPAVKSGPAIQQLHKRLVVAIDKAGTRYFKRLQLRPPLAILESLNSDGTTAAELLSLDPAQPYPELSEVLEVVGVLFELPDSKKTK